MESKNTTMIILVIVGLVIGAPIGYFMAPTKTVEVPGEKETVKVPSLSGEIPLGVMYASAGHIDTAGPAIQIALEEVNDYVDRLGLNVTFTIIEENCQSESTIALEKFQSLVASGVEAVAGPNWSGQCKAIKDYADEHEVVVFSDGSTSPVLEIADDYIFRLPVTDKTQASALAPAIWNMGIRHLIIVNRADAWGDGNYETMSELWEGLGGDVPAHIRYDSSKTEFSAEAATLNDKVVELTNQYGADTVGIAVWSFGEFTALYSSCKEYQALVDATWFGSDGYGRSTTLIEEVPDCYETRFLCMIMGTSKSTRYEQFVDKYVERSGGRLPGTYNTHMYDIIWLLSKATLEAGEYDGSTIKEVLPTVAEQYYGACGWTKLNEYGDRAESNYELWTVELNATDYPEWVVAATYDSAAGKLSWNIPIEEK